MLHFDLNSRRRMTTRRKSVCSLVLLVLVLTGPGETGILPEWEPTVSEMFAVVVMVDDKE